jgi:hypothetical protein
MRRNTKHIILVLFIFFASVASIIKLQQSHLEHRSNKKSLKEIEFSHAKIVEVDQEKVKSITDADTMYKTKDQFVMFGVAFSNSFDDRLFSHKAIQKATNIHFYKDVRFKRHSGFTYYTNHAVYNRKSEILLIKERFKAIRDSDSFYGHSMVYYTNQGYIDAKRVDSILSLEQK